MKRSITFFAFMVLAIVLFAQAPSKISFQAVIRNSTNQLVTNSLVGMRFSILKGEETGVAVYIETTTTKTNANGLVTTEIGTHNIVYGSIGSIDWENGPYFLKTETDPAGGSNYSITGTSPILSVPIALYATKAGNGFSGSYIDLTNKPTLFDGSWNSLTGKPPFAFVATSGSYNDLSNKPTLFSGKYNDLTDKPALALVATSGSYNDLSNKPITDGSETKVTAGNNIAVTGSGTGITPYIINLNIPHYVGELYGGGAVFYVDHTGNHGLICGMVDVSGNQSWSNITSTQIGIAAQSDWDGKSNTNAIINQPGQSYSAAKLCKEYTNADYGTGIYNDWYLPTALELAKLYDALYQLNKTFETDGNSSTTPIWKNNVYWSSNERDSNNAYYFDFNGGSYGFSGKYNFLPVRAVRSF